MHRLKYVSSAGESFDLDGGIAYAGTATDLRGRSWEYSLGASSLRSPRRAAREVTLDLCFKDSSAADALRAAADGDAAAGTGGSLVLDGWSARAVIVEQTPSVVFGRYMRASVKVALLDGVWRRSSTVSFVPSQDGGGDFLDLPHDLPHDLAAPPTPTALEVAARGSSPVGAIVYGPAVSPYFTIAGNTYKVDASLAEGDYLVIDPVSSPKRVYKVSAQGVETDCFALASRGTGEGGGSYIFERVPHGVHEVSWPRSFGFDLILYEEEGEPPWSS